MKRRLKIEKRWILVSIVSLIVFIPLAVRVEKGQLNWADWTGFGEDREITQTDEVPSECNAYPECPVIKRTFATKFQSGKTFWDLLGVAGSIAVPILLVYLANRLQVSQQKQAEEAAALQQRLAEDAAKEEVLQAYFDRLSTLLIDKNIVAIAVKYQKAASDSAGDKFIDEQKELIDAAKDVIRARTLSILRRLNERRDRTRRTDVIKFLIETEIISKLQLDFSGADLSNIDILDANLSRANLSDTDLSKADIRDVNLNHANLSYIDACDVSLLNTSLSRADLGGAYFIRPHFINVDLSSAYLCRTVFDNGSLFNIDLKDAIVLGADLSTVRELTNEQLEGEHAPFLCKVKLPEGITIDPNRDCEQLPKVLLDRYPDQFKTLDKAKQFVEDIREY